MSTFVVPTLQRKRVQTDDWKRQRTNTEEYEETSMTYHPAARCAAKSVLGRQSSGSIQFHCELFNVERRRRDFLLLVVFKSNKSTPSTRTIFVVLERVGNRAICDWCPIGLLFRFRFRIAHQVLVAKPETKFRCFHALDTEQRVGKRLFQSPGH